jgi:hypothetical protein
MLVEAPFVRISLPKIMSELSEWKDHQGHLVILEISVDQDQSDDVAQVDNPGMMDQLDQMDLKVDEVEEVSLDHLLQGLKRCHQSLMKKVRKKMGVAYHHLSYHQSQDQKDHQDHQVLTDQEGHMVYEETLDNLDQQ